MTDLRKGEDQAAIAAQAGIVSAERSAVSREIRVARRGGFVILTVGDEQYPLRKKDARRLGALLSRAGL